MRILGIDLGSKSIKAVEIDSAFGRFEIHEYHEEPLAPGEEPTVALARLMHGLHKEPDRLAVAIRSGQLTFRNLTLPTRDKKAILSSVAFELEDELPFPIENAVYDMSILSQGKLGSTVHVAATLKLHLENFLKAWSAAGVDPDFITSESWAYRCLLNRVLGPDPGAQEKPVLLVHIGHERTVLYLHHRGRPVASRELLWGGRDLTLAMCQKYHIPLDQAEAAKLDHGFVLPQSRTEEVTQEQLDLSETLMGSIRELIKEIRQTRLTCKNLTQESLETIYLAGGTSLLPGLNRVIEEDLQIPVKPLQSLSAVATSGVTYSEQTDAAFALAVSIALCLVGPDKTSSINFRRGEFAKQGRTTEINFASLKRPAQAFGAIAFCFFLSLFVQSTVYQREIIGIDSQLERAMKGFFTGLSGSAVRTYMANTTTLRASINKELGKQRDLNKLITQNPHSPLDFLKELSSSVSKDIVTDMTVYQVGAAPTSPYSPTDETSTSLTFLVANPQVAERLNSSLSGRIRGLQKSKLEEVTAPDGSGKRWKVTFTGKVQEDAYGK